MLEAAAYELQHVFIPDQDYSAGRAGASGGGLQLSSTDALER